MRAFLDPVSFIEAETVSLILVLIATAIMARIERRRFQEYGIPPLHRAFGRDFWVGAVWGVGSTSLLIGLIAAFGGYRILGSPFMGLSCGTSRRCGLIASLLIGLAEELQFRAYLLATTADGIGFWAAAILLSAGFGALHYFFKPHERWEDFASTGLLGLFMCLDPAAHRLARIRHRLSRGLRFRQSLRLVRAKRRRVCHGPPAVRRHGKARNGSPEDCLAQRQAAWSFP